MSGFTRPAKPPIRYEDGRYVDAEGQRLRLTPDIIASELTDLINRRLARSSCAASERQRNLAWSVIHQDHHLRQEEVRELARAVLAIPESGESDLEQYVDAVAEMRQRSASAESDGVYICQRPGCHTIFPAPQSSSTLPRGDK